MERKCEHCKCTVKPGEWLATVDNGEGRFYPWCVSCAIRLLDDDGTLNVSNTLPAMAREMHRHSTALAALSRLYIQRLEETTDVKHPPA